MRVLVHDFAGHPFQVELSRWLADKGHETLHLYCASVTSPRGDLTRRPEDPRLLVIRPIELNEPFDRYSPLTRLRHERRYGTLLAAQARTFKPDVILSANTPLLSQQALFREAKSVGAAKVFWLQDLLGIGIRDTLGRKLRFAGRILGWPFVALERSLLRRSEAVIVITDDFSSILTDAGVAPTRVHDIPNWAPLKEIDPLPKDNAFAREHGLADSPTVLYGGTLGIKHNPELLLSLARALPEVRVVVMSEGSGADWLTEQLACEKTPNLELLPFQPYEKLPAALASADLLVVILEHEAGVFSVPSKLLSYLCAGRAMVAAIPEQNLAARIVDEAGAGVVVDPREVKDFVSAARTLLQDRQRRLDMGRRARAYAERRFAIDMIGERFERVLRDSIKPIGGPTARQEGRPEVSYKEAS